MNELRLKDFFSPDPMEASLRELLRPWRNDLAERTPQIRIDVSEADGAYAVKAEIPGVRKEDLDVRIDGNQVTISAEVKNDREEKSGARVLRSECKYGFASRSFTLAENVDETKADAKYKDGVLQLTLPKRAQSTHKRLAIG